MDPSDINDVRLISEFKEESFSGYKKSEVKKELMEDLIKGKIENACHWCAELICGGQLMELWEIILLYTSKHIHTGNPKLPIYIDMRFQNFKEIMKGGYVGNELNMRNNPKIRRLFCEIICILCLSNKKHSFEKIKVKQEDYDMTSFSDKLRAPNVMFINNIFEEGDPKELFIPLNELSYNIDIGNNVQACYWIEWIMGFETMCIKKKEKCVGSFRTFAEVENKYQNDIVWIIWDILIHKTMNDHETIQRIIRSLITLYSIKYTPAVKKRRIYILYYAVTICCENININITLFRNKDLIEGVCSKVNQIYKEIKKNEKSPNTDYLFDGTEKSNVEKTIDKLNKVNTLGDMIIRTE
tara:strand:+ start:5252 stop:6316 length:1065 start_codon:yes stop_codon:yes gene_type:complete